MRALSGRQPWWWAILHAGKRIENRLPTSSATSQLRIYRRQFLLHASKGVGPRWDFHEACLSVRRIIGESAWGVFADEQLVRVAGAAGERWAPGPGLMRSGIVGRARVVGILEPDGRPRDLEAREAISRYAVDLRWHIRGQVGHILADVQPLPFVACRGMLGLWQVPLAAAVAAMGTAHV